MREVDLDLAARLDAQTRSGPRVVDLLLAIELLQDAGGRRSGPVERYTTRTRKSRTPQRSDRSSLIIIHVLEVNSSAGMPFSGSVASLGANMSVALLGVVVQPGLIAPLRDLRAQRRIDAAVAFQPEHEIRNDGGRPRGRAVAAVGSVASVGLTDLR